MDLFLGGSPRGNITFGLIQGSEKIDGESNNLITDTFYSCNSYTCKSINRLLSSTDTRFNGVFDLTPFYILLLCLLLTIPLTLANMAFEFVNTYQAVKEWWRGPATFYVISLVIGTYNVKAIILCCCHVSKFLYRYIFFIL